MSRINTNVNSLIAQRVLRKNNDQLNLSLERLSTGLKINRGADNPAGLIASENLRLEKTGNLQVNAARLPDGQTVSASLGMSSVSTGSLGTALDTAGTAEFLSSLASGGPNALNAGNLVRSQRILDKAVKQVNQLRGRLGVFQKFTIGSTVNSLGVALENASAAESAIRDTDFAQETAKLTRAQILSQAATTVLAQANASPQSALSLLQ